MSFSKSLGKKQDSSAQSNSHQQKQQNRNNNSNKKWANNNNNNNNATASTTRNHHASTTGIEQDAATTKQLHDRMLFLLGNLTGTLVEATVKDGCKFRGIFHGASTEGDLGIALKLAQKIHDPNAPIDKDKTNPNPIKNTMLIFSNDLVEINAVNVDFASSSSSGTEATDRNTFKTDTDISGKLDIKERELHRWEPTEEDHGHNHSLLDGGLESNDSDAHGGSWDQFAANEKLFGLKTDFDEEIYTTPLNRSAPGYKDREKRAIKMANEIQKTATTNVHMLEERGVAIDDSGMDEEDLYGAVVREGSSNPNKYVPPALRKLQQQQQQQQQAQKKEKPITAAGNPLNKLITSDLPKTASNPSPIANLPTTRRESSEKNNAASNEPPKRIEAEIATTFRHFAMMEKDKLHAKKQALQKKEKDGRLAELKAFHQSFKLNVPIPADLVPLLSKKKAAASNEQASSSSSDASNKNVVSPVKKTSTPPLPSSTQQAATASTAAAAAAATTAKKASSPAPAVASTTSPAPPSPAPAATATTTNTTTTTASSPATSNSFKFNVKASSFKPNPSAAAFVPGGGASRSPAPVHMGMPMPQHTSTAVAPEDHSHPHAFFGGNNGRQFHSKKGNGPVEHLTMTEAFVPSFIDKNIPASSVGPTWPFGHKSYRVQFSQFGYDEDVYSYPSPNYGYYPTQYRYPFPHHQMPYPQFVQPPPMPPGAYSPQMANVSPHGSPFPPPPPSVAVPAPPPQQQQQQQQQQVPPQGYPSPQQRSPMVPQQMPPPQMYQYGGGAPMMMRYPPDMMMQRPVMVETVPYSPHHPQQQQQQQQDTPAATTDSGTDTPPSNQ